MPGVLLHNIALMSVRLLPALLLSLALHASLFAPEVLKRDTAPPPRPALLAMLRPAPEPPAEPLLKNTLDTEPEKPRVEPPPSPPPKKPSQATRPTNNKVAVKAAQKKLSRHLYYPEEAVRRGLEGEVRLLLTLAADGHIADITIAASSGHSILDNAAMKAAYAMGTLSGADSRELILPVIFRLQ